MILKAQANHYRISSSLEIAKETLKKDRLPPESQDLVAMTKTLAVYRRKLLLLPLVRQAEIILLQS
jgi:hypothetical protein